MDNKLLPRLTRGWLIAVVVLIMLGVALVLWMRTTPLMPRPPMVPHMTHLTGTHKQPVPAVPVSPAPATASASGTSSAQVQANLLKQPLPRDPALVRDELAQLDAMQQQLTEQRKLLEQQHQDADQLIQLKEAQLADLISEAQSGN